MNSDKNINLFLKYTAFALVLAVLLVPMIVSPSMFFLFITGKAYTFRVLVEIIAVLWLILALRDRSYMPKKSWVIGAVALFTLIVGVADAFGVEPLRSIWSNYERMEGFVWIAHLFVYFVAASSLIGGGKGGTHLAATAEKERTILWAIFAHFALLVSVIVGIHGLGQLSGQPAGFRIDSYLGNSTYLGVYALVHFFLALMFWIRNIYEIGDARVKHAKQKVETILQLVGYTLVGAFNLLVMYHTGTRGSVVGLACGLLFVSFIIALREKSHKIIRGTGIAILVLVVATVITLGASKNSDFVKKNNLLARFSALATFDIKGVLTNEGHARSLLWGIAYNGFKENPVLGWGQDNFGYVFTKHYNPEMYGQETWFDRTHNVIFDWLISAGLLGLLSYLGLFAAVIWSLWRKSDFALGEKATITGLFIAYFIHNLFVFDNLSSYIVFFSLLAYIHSRVAGAPVIPARAGEVTAHARETQQTLTNYLYIPLVVIVGASVLWSVNIPGYRANKELISAMTACRYKKLDDAKKIFVSAIADSSYGGRSEIREQLLSCASSIANDANVDASVKSSWIEMGLISAEEQVKTTPNDTRSYVAAASYASAIGNQPLAQQYWEGAVKTAPKKQQPMISLALLYINTKQADKGFALLDEVRKNTPGNAQIDAIYASALVFVGRDADAERFFGATSSVMTDDRVISVYESKKQYAKVIAAYRARAAAAPGDIKAAAAPGVYYMKLKDTAAAIREFEALKQKFPQYVSDLNTVISVIKTGKNPFEEGQQ